MPFGDSLCDVVSHGLCACVRYTQGVCVFVCVALPGVSVHVRDCGVCVLRVCLCVVCKDCVVLYGVLFEWCLSL